MEAPPATGLDAQGARRRSWPRIVGTLGGLFLGGVFLLAVWGKMLDPDAFAEVIEVEGLAFLVPAFALAIGAIALEAWIGFALLLDLRRLWVLLPTTGLVVFFLFLTGKAYIKSLRGEDPGMASCGCFGNLFDRTPAEAFWLDFALMVPPLVLAWFGRPRGPFPWIRGAASVALAVGVGAFALRAPGMDLDDLATRLAPGVELADLCAGSGEDEICLTGEALGDPRCEGRHVILMADIADEAFVQGVADRVEELAAWAEDYENPRLLLLHSGQKEDEAAFSFRSLGAPMDPLIVPAELLRPLYRSLPRTFVVEDGRVLRTWSGFPALSELKKP